MYPSPFVNYTQTTDPVQEQNPPRGQIVEGLSLIASGRYLSHWLNFILSKQHRSPATECRNPGAPDFTKNVGSYFSPDLPALTLISLEPPDLTKNVGSYLSPNLPAPYHRVLPYKNKHYNKSSIYDRMKFKIKLNQIWLLSVWVGSSMRYFHI